MSQSTIQYIIEPRQWRDKVNGNTYQAITIKDATTREVVYKSPMFYGYGEHYKTETVKFLLSAGLLPSDIELSHELKRQWLYYAPIVEVNKRDL